MDWLLSPLAQVDALYARTLVEQAEFNPAACCAAAVGPILHQVGLLRSVEGASSSHPALQVASLNEHTPDSIKPFTLVRLRCMVQETFDPELYLDVITETSQSTGESV